MSKYEFNFKNNKKARIESIFLLLTIAFVIWLVITIVRPVEPIDSIMSEAKQSETNDKNAKSEMKKVVTKESEFTLKNVPFSDNKTVLNVLRELNEDIVNFSIKDKVAFITIDKDKPYFDENSVIQYTAEDNYNVMYSLLTREDVEKVSLVVPAPVQNIKGKETIDTVVEVDWTKDTIDGIDIDNFKPENFYRVSSGYVIIPAIFSIINSEIKNKYLD